MPVIAADLAGSEGTEPKSLSEWSTMVKARDGRSCQHCGSRDHLHAHHIKPKSNFAALALSVENGVTLCRACHSAVHGGQLGAFILNFPGGFRGRSRKQHRSPESFCSWLEAMKITGEEAARLLGVTPNTITRYRRTGAPRAIGLACAALFHRINEWKWK